MSDTSDTHITKDVPVTVTAGTPRNGKFPVRVMREQRVLHAGRVNPHEPQDIDAFVAQVCEQFPGIEEQGLRDELLQLAEPGGGSATAEAADGDPGAAEYEATDSGLVWHKPTKDGSVPVRLTNFDAKILTDVVRDDGAERQHQFEIQATRGDIQVRFEVPAAQFGPMNWPVERLGATAVVYPGMGTRDRAAPPSSSAAAT